MVAVTAAVTMLNLPTPPGDCPGMGALGMATKALVLSVQTNRLSVGAGRAIAVAVTSVALSTTAITLLDGLTTRVRSRFGDNAIMPASGSTPASETPAVAAIISLDASTISSAGKIAPVLLS